MLNPISLTLAAARQIIFAAETKAFQLAFPSIIAVVDISGQLIAYVRMDGARLDPDRQSTQKALDVLAALHSWERRAKSRAQAMAEFDAYALKIDVSEIPIGWKEHMVATLEMEAGGVPIDSDGERIGAIGVSGGTPESNHAIALAALDAYASCFPSDEYSVPKAKWHSSNNFFNLR